MTKDVEIIESREVFKEFIFRMEKTRYRHRRFDGTMSDELVRLNLDRADSVAALLHDVDNDEVLLIEQFRVATYQKGPGWILELPAGIVERGEDPRETMRREIHEETGFEVTDLRPIALAYLSPGGSTERIHLFYAMVSPHHRASPGGGLASEGEDIRLVSLTKDDAFRKLESGEFVDAKTIMALQWWRHQTM